jgi:KUP system potassium uptake protein
MRVDNHGEGGIMALMALLAGQNKIAFGLFGAALIYGDGAITPASPRHPRSATGRSMSAP